MLLVLLFAAGGIKSRRKEEEASQTEKEMSTEGTWPEKEITDHTVRGQDGRTTRGRFRELDSPCEQGTTKPADEFFLSNPRGQL